MSASSLSEQTGRVAFWTVIGVAGALNLVQACITTNPNAFTDGMETVLGWLWPIISQGGIGYHTEISFRNLCCNLFVAVFMASMAKLFVKRRA